MPKLRKMLGNVDSRSCVSLMGLMETQSKATLASWAVDYAQSRFLPIYEVECPGDLRLRETLAACREHLEGNRPLNTVKPLLKEAAQIARDAASNPIAQAAARAVSTACASVQTSTNALGFLFYGAAAATYSQAGLTASAEVYDGLAASEWKKALDSFQKAAIPDEPNPAKLSWNC